ncbi:MAG: hypothetical protein KA144_01240 [Xanthomonadaceae bacterium]|nr:hypothetical protein [Xanthomonadaceae bacterium]
MNDAHRIIMGFVEANSDVHRNRDDQKLSASNSVKYVFDTDILSIFVSPKQYLTQDFGSDNKSRTFSIDWGIRFDASDQESLPEISAQHALIMSEYLMSGSLPGSDGIFYFTPWHASELDNSFLFLNANLSARRSYLKDALAKEMRSYFEKISQTCNESDHAEDAINIMSNVTKLLAEDETIEPLEQLRRFGRKLASSTRIVTDSMRASEIDAAWVASEAKAWQSRIREATDKRSANSIRNDALSIALLRFISMRSQEGSILFVTGDNKLFDIYRNWYYEKHRDEPFFFRRFAQYNPTLNTKSANSDYSKGSGSNLFFQSINYLISSVIIRHVLAFAENELNDYLHSISSNNNRFQWLAYRCSQRSDFPYLKITNSEKKKIFLLKSKLGHIQKKISGIFSESSSKRLPEDLRKLLDATSRERFFDLVKQVIEVNLAEIDEAAISLFREAGIQRILFMYGLDPIPKRTPDTLLYKIGGETLADIIRKLSDRKAPKEKPWLELATFTQLHAYASAVALSTRQWEEAELQVKAALSNPKNDDQEVELTFLSCVVTRYAIANSIGHIPSHDQEHCQAKIKNLYDIQHRLTKIASHIGTRYNSESAALNVFAAQSLIVFYDHESAFEPLTKAMRHICFCLDEFSREGTASDPSLHQLTHNFASCLILSTILKTIDPRLVVHGFSTARIGFVSERIWRTSSDSIPLFIRLEKLLFEQLVSKSEPAQDSLKEIAKIAKSSLTESNNLTIDVLLCKRIIDLLSSSKSLDFFSAGKALIYYSFRGHR